MNSSNIDRRIALSALLIVFGIHFLLLAFPQTGYHFGILVPAAAYVIFLGLYGVVAGLAVAVGVPLMTPVLALRESPAGSVPPVIVQVL